MVSQNFSELEVSYSNRHNFGVIVDGILDILSEDNEGLNIGCRIDDLIKNHLPELYRVRNSGFLNFNRSRVKINVATVFGKERPEISADEILVSLGKLSSLRWETLAYIKSGATRGTNFGTLTDLCHEQVEKMSEIAASVLGEDPSILEPGYFSKLFSSPLQIGWRWNPKRWCWGTNEDYLDCNKTINPALEKFSVHQLISNMPEEWITSYRRKLNLNF